MNIILLGIYFDILSNSNDPGFKHLIDHHKWLKMGTGEGCVGVHTPLKPKITRNTPPAEGRGGAPRGPEGTPNFTIFGKMTPGSTKKIPP